MSDLMDQLPICDFSRILLGTSQSVRIMTQQNEVYLHKHYEDIRSIMAQYPLFYL